MKVMPPSIASWVIRIASSRLFASPKEEPPNQIADTCTPVFPNERRGCNLPSAIPQLLSSPQIKEGKQNDPNNINEMPE